MTTFSMGDAIGSGFGLIARKPLAVLVWGLAYLVLGVLPILALFAGVLPAMSEMMRHPETFTPGPGYPAYPPAFLQMQSRMMMMQPLVFVGSIVGRTVITTAVFRGVLEPANDRWFYLRLGMQELWVGLSLFVLSILAAIGAFVVFLPIGAVAAGIGFALYQSGQQGWIALDAVVAVVAALWIYTWLCVRFSLALPMSFAEREFRLFESWSLTKGHALKLFGLGVLLFVIMCGVMAVIYAVVIAIGLGTLGASGISREHIRALFQRPPQEILAAAAPWFALLIVVGSFLTAAISAIFLAPWAVAYREIVGGSAAPPPAYAAPSAPPPPPPEPAAPATDPSSPTSDPRQGEPGPSES